MSLPDPLPIDDKDRALDEDIRLLGAVLGDVVREDAGERAFDLVERARQAAVAHRRDGAADGALTAILRDASLDNSLHVIRAFSWFSLLANIAEDVHHNRRRRYHRSIGSPPQPGSLAFSLNRIAASGVTTAEMEAVIGKLFVSPVITAHPTEVRRRTVLDNQREIARLLANSLHSSSDASERHQWDSHMRQAVVTLWQTAILRLSKLRVRDEIVESLRYYRSSLFEVVPALQRGTVDCMVLPWDLMVAFKLQEVAKFGLAINLGALISNPQWYNLNKWQELPANVRDLLTAVAKDALAIDLAKAKESERNAHTALKAAGVEILPFPDQAKFEALMPDFIGEWVGAMQKVGRGAEAEAMAKRWKALK